MPKWAETGQVKIERADQHVRDLERRSVAFLKAPPYRLIFKKEPETGDTVYCWKRRASHPGIPLEWGAIAGDAIHNLRSAIDILWHQATAATANRSRGTYFPFVGAEKLEARLRRVKEPSLKAALQIARGFKPYQTGNEQLWLLHQASIMDKHQVPMIVVCVFEAGAFDIRPPSWWSEADLILQGDLRFTDPALVEDGVEFARTRYGQGLKFNKQIKPTFGIAFGKCGALQGKPVLKTLREFTSIANAIAEAFLRGGLIR
jgi:hypothetical protein